MALKVGALYATVSLDDKDFSRGVDQSKGKFAGLVGGVTRGGLLIAGALVGVGAAGGALSLKLGGMASDLNESMSKVGVVFGDLGDEIIGWSKGSATALGMTQQAALEAAGTYGNLFRSMGLGEQASADMSQNLVELSADLASFNNQDPTEVLDKLRAGLTGETEPLKSLGVNLSAAAIEAKAMEMGLASAAGELDAGAKAQASYALILEQTKLAQGDFARTSDGMANQQRILGATFEDAMTQIGQAVVPIFEAILPQLTAALQGLAEWVMDNGPAIQETLATAFAIAGEAVGALVTVFGVLVNDVFPAIAGAVAIVVENLDILMPALAAMAVAIAAAVIPAFVAWAATAGAAAIATITALAPVIAPIVAIGAAVAGLGLIWREWGDDIQRIIGRVGSFIGTTFGRIGRMVGDTWDAIASGVKGGINTIIGMVNAVIGFLNNIVVPIPRVTIPGTDIGIGGGVFDPFNMKALPKLAGGGRILREGMAIVGEEGPELVHMRAGADVFSAGATRAMLAAMGGDGGGGATDSSFHQTVNVNAPTVPVTPYDIGLEARRAVRLGLRRRASLQGA